MFKRFKLAYKRASDAKAEVFLFDSNWFDVGYAKYLIEYLEPKFKSVR
jgi:hypothetical protein